MAAVIGGIIIGDAAIGIVTPRGALDKVPADDIIDIAVVVIVYTVAGNFAVVDPDVAVGAAIIRARRVGAAQLVVIVSYTTVDDRHDNVRVSRFLVPGGIDVDTVAVPVMPLHVGEARRGAVVIKVVRRCGHTVQADRLHPFNKRKPPIGLHHRLQPAFREMCLVIAGQRFIDRM